MVAPALPAATQPSQPLRAALDDADRFTQRPQATRVRDLASRDTDTLRQNLEHIERRIAHTTRELERWRSRAERSPQSTLPAGPQLTRLTPPPWRPLAAGPDELEQAETLDSPTFDDAQVAQTQEASRRAISPVAPSIALALVNEPLRESLLGAPALGAACRRLLAQLGSTSSEPRVLTHLRQLDRFIEDRKHIEAALLKVRAVQRGKLLTRYPQAAPYAPSGPASAVASGSRALSWRVETNTTLGYPKRLTKLVGGAEALAALPCLNVGEVLGAQGRLGELTPTHVPSHLMRGMWPRAQLFLVFKLWQQPKVTEPAEAGLVLLVQNEVQPLKWETLNPLHFRPDQKITNLSPTFMELHNERVIGNQEGERFLAGLERLVVSDEGRVGMYARQQPPQLGAPRVAFEAPGPSDIDPPPRRPLLGQTPKKSALKVRSTTQIAPPPRDDTEPVSQREAQLVEHAAQPDIVVQPLGTSVRVTARGTGSTSPSLPKGRAQARPVLATRRTDSTSRAMNPTRVQLGASPRGRNPERAQPDDKAHRQPRWR